MAGEVQTPFAKVTVGGVARPAKSFSITREIATDLPSEIVGGGGMVAATGSVEWSDDLNGVATARVDAPAANTSVVVEAGVDGSAGALSQLFTGVIDSSGGQASDYSSNSGIVDRSRSLSKPVIVPVHLAREVSGLNQVTPTGLSSLWLAHEVARFAGWGAYHYTSRTAVWASLAGSILPHNGNVPGYADVGDWAPAATPTGGVGISLEPTRNIEYDIDPIGLNSSVAAEASVWIDPSLPGKTAFVFYGFSVSDGGRGFAMDVGDGHLRAFQVEGSGTMLDIDVSAQPGFQRVGFHLSWNSAGWTVRLRLGANVYVSSQVADTTALTRANGSDKWTFLVQRVTGAATPSVMSGLVIDRQPSTTPQWTEFGYAPKFKTLSDPFDFQTWQASRLIDGEDALDILKGIASAECAGLWVDEDGVLTLMSRQYMKDQPLGPVVTSTDNLLDYNWAKTLDSLRSTVTVKHLLPAYSVRTSWNMTVWAGQSDQRFKAGETVQQFIEPDTLADWWQPDLAISWGSVDAKPVSTTWWGGKVRVDSTDAVVRTATSTDATVTLTKLGYQKALLSVTAASIGAANYLDTMGTPVIRARGRVSWTEQTYTSTILGPLDAPALEHDCGWYVQSTVGRQRIADFLAAATNGDFPVIENVSIVPDPSIRLGMKVTVRDTHVKGWRFDGIVFRYTIAGEDGSMTQTLGLRVTAFVPDFAVNLAQLDARWAGTSLTALDAARAGKTLTQVDAAPLA